MQVPEGLRYTPEHEWARIDDDGTIRVGITDYAQDQLGDVVFVELSEVGAEVAQGDMVAEVESTKSVAEVYAPMAGTVEEVNEVLRGAPEIINQDPYGEGWFVRIRASGEPGEDGFLDAAGYRALTE